MSGVCRMLQCDGKSHWVKLEWLRCIETMENVFWQYSVGLEGYLRTNWKKGEERRRNLDCIEVIA